MKHKRNVAGRSCHMAQHDSCENMTWEKGRTVYEKWLTFGAVSHRKVQNIVTGHVQYFPGALWKGKGVMQDWNDTSK